MDAAHLPKVLRVIERGAKGVQPLAVHEHDAIHELHALLPAGIEHLGELGQAGSAGLLADDVFTRRRGLEHPFLAEAGWERDVNGVHGSIRQHFLVAAVSLRHGLHRSLRLAFIDELAAAFHIAAGHGDDGRVAAVANRLPVLPRDVRRAENAPAKFGL